jgi:trehalose 6-phosphate phosphatase
VKKKRQPLPKRRPRYVFRRRGEDLRNLVARAAGASRIFLFLDYDGTLTPLRKIPGRAILSRAMMHLLVQLSRLPGTTLTIVTGRSLDDIKSLVAWKRLQFAANHGFEIEAAGRKWTHPDARPMMSTLSRIAPCLGEKLGNIPGVLVQDKGSTLTVHYRNVTPRDVHIVQRVVRKIVRPFRQVVRVTTGKKVIEVRPNIAWGKGHAVRWILKRLRAPRSSVVLYCGDDKTDEDAFRLLPGSAITIHVGDDGASYARYYVRTVSEMHRVLRTLYAEKHQLLKA